MNEEISDPILDEYGYETAERAAIIQFDAKKPKWIAEKEAIKITPKEAPQWEF